jgi:hypothetical protein
MSSFFHTSLPSIIPACPLPSGREVKKIKSIISHMALPEEIALTVRAIMEIRETVSRIFKIQGKSIITMLCTISLLKLVPNQFSDRTLHVSCGNKNHYHLLNIFTDPASTVIRYN